MKNKIKIGEKKEILKLIGLGVLFTASLAIPNLPLVLQPFLNNKCNKYNYKNRIKALRKKNLIILDSDKVKLSKRGLKIFEQIEIQDIKIKKTKWDKL